MRYIIVAILIAAAFMVFCSCRKKTEATKLTAKPVMGEQPASEIEKMNAWLNAQTKPVLAI